jgi:hypothetical protein
MKSLKTIIVLLVVGVAIYVGVMVLPVYFNYYQFQDAIEEEARIQTYTGKSVTDMRESMFKKAQQLELPLTKPDDILVERAGNGVTISTEYTVHIALPLYPLDLKFQPTTKNKMI